MRKEDQPILSVVKPARAVVFRSPTSLVVVRVRHRSYPDWNKNGRVNEDFTNQLRDEEESRRTLRLASDTVPAM